MIGRNKLILRREIKILKERIAQRPGKIAENNIKSFDTIKQMFEEPRADEDFIRIDNY